MEEPVPTIDRLHQLEQALQEWQALALAGQFAAAIMHEINGPLEAISNLNYLVRTNSDDGEQVRNYSGLLEEQLGVLNMVSRQTLSFYHSRETVEPLLIAPLAEAALRVHHNKIAAKEIRLLKKLPGDVIVESHAGAMLQVFSNIIGNAVEALPVRGTLQIRARSIDGEAHILFADNGHGIPDAIRDRIFEPFFSTKRSVERGWGWRSPKRLSNDIAAGSEAGLALAPAETELPSASPCPYVLIRLQPQNKTPQYVG